MKEKLQKIASVLNKRSGRDAKCIELKKIIGTKPPKEVVEEFEFKRNEFEKGSLPINALILYLALMEVIRKDPFEKSCTNDFCLSKISTHVKDRESYQWMTVGYKLLLKGESRKIRYEVTNKQHSENRNPYQYIQFMEMSIIEDSYEIEGLLDLLELIYQVEHEKLYELLKGDKHNNITLSFLLTRFEDAKYEKLLPLLKSEDEYLANAAFYLLMKRFNELKRSDPESEAYRLIEENIEEIWLILSKVPYRQVIALIINYIFSEEAAPQFFFEYLKLEQQEEWIVELIGKQHFNHPQDFLGFEVLLVEVPSKKVEKLFIEKLCEWLKKSEYHIEDAVSVLKQPLNHLKYEKGNLIEELITFKKKLCITSFDRQVRPIIYRIDCAKREFIDNILSYIGA